MNLKGSILEKSEWEFMEKDAHQDLFGGEFFEEARDYHYCVIVKNESGESFGYATVKESDRESAYLNFGGMFKKFRESGRGYQLFHAIVECIKNNYKRVGFACRTKNTAMIKLGLNEGFEIVGLRKIYGFPSVEFLLERGI